QAPAVARAPAILVGLAAAQEIELGRAVADRLLDGVAEQDGPETEPCESRVEAGQVDVRAAVVQEAVVDRGDLAVEAERIQPQRTLRREARCRTQVELPHRLVREDSGLPALGPAVAVKAEQLAEQRRDVVGR